MTDEGCRKGQIVYEPYKYHYFDDDESPSSIRQEFCYKDGSSYSWINSSYFEIPSTEVDGINLNDGAHMIIDNKNYYSSESNYKYDKNNNILIYTKLPFYGKDFYRSPLHLKYDKNKNSLINISQLYPNGKIYSGFDIDHLCVFNHESLPSNHSYLINTYYVLDNSNKHYI